MPKLVAALALVTLMLAVPAAAMEVGSERLFEGTVKVTVASDMARPMRLDALGFSIGGDAAAVNGGEVAKGSSNSCPRFRLEGHRRCHT